MFAHVLKTKRFITIRSGDVKRRQETRVFQVRNGPAWSSEEFISSGGTADESETKKRREREGVKTDEEAG